MVFKNFLSKAKDIDILSSLPDGVILVDEESRIEWANENAASLLKVSKNDLFKLNLNELIESGLDLTKQAAQSSQHVVGRIKTSNARENYIEITAKPIDNYIVVAFRDVTQSYKTVSNIIQEHESSRKISKDKNQFLLKLSNEFKSPVHSILGFSQAMIDGLGGEMSDKQEKYIKIINKNSNELLYFLDKILELSKTESGLFEQEFQTFDITNTIQSVLKNFEQTIKDKKLSLTLEVDESTKKTAFSDENIFKTIMHNLFETSLNLTDIGSIRVSIKHPETDVLSASSIVTTEDIPESAFVQITICDTGAGISEGDLGVIFEPYAQLDRPNKKNIVRSVALASAKNLVKSLKGDIWIESEPMQGAVYNFIIPIEKGL